MTAGSDPRPSASRPGTPKKRKTPAPLAKENRRLIAGLVLGAIVAVFAVVNVNDVEVDWIFTTSQTPLIVVIAIAFLVGALIGWLVGAVARARK